MISMNVSPPKKFASHKPPTNVCFYYLFFVGSFINIALSPGNENDLEYYVRECGEILGITSKLPKDARDSKHILEHVFFQIVNFKKALEVS